MDKEFEELQDRMVERASVYKDTKFDPFYRFMTGEINWNKCIEKISETFKKQII
jgi:hypothetical protein